jgi:hypothetical protein
MASPQTPCKLHRATTGQQRPSSTCLPVPAPARPRLLSSCSANPKRAAARHRLPAYSAKGPPGFCASDAAVFCGECRYAFVIGSTPQPRSRRVLRALLAHSRLPNPQACTPKQTALDIHFHQHTSGAALLHPPPDHTAPLELGFCLSLRRRRHCTPTRPSPIPHAISPSLLPVIKRVWYVYIREHNTRLGRPHRYRPIRVLRALPLPTCARCSAASRSSRLPLTPSSAS